VSKKHKKQDDKPDEEQSGRYHWLKISGDNFFYDGTIRQIMSMRYGLSYAFIIEFLHALALGERLGCVMIGFTPADINDLRSLSKYMGSGIRESEVRKSIEIGKEKGLIVTIGTEIWLTQIHRFVGSPAARKSNQEKYFSQLKEAASSWCRETTETPLCGSEKLREISFVVQGNYEKTREAAREANSLIEKKDQKDLSVASAHPLSGVGQEAPERNGNVKGGRDVEPSKGLTSASPLSGAGEDAGDVKPSEAMKKILDDIGEEPNPFNGNDGFKFEW